MEAPEIIARKSALHNLTLGLGKRTFYIVLNPRRFCWHLRTGGCPKKKNDTRDICDLHAGYVENKKDESFQQIPTIQTRKNSRRVVGFIHFMGTPVTQFVLSCDGYFFWRPRCLSIFVCWVEVQNSSSKKVARHLGSKVKRGHGLIEILQILLQTLHTCP